MKYPGGMSVQMKSHCIGERQFRQSGAARSVLDHLPAEIVVRNDRRALAV
jgi:hypothetical protein